MSAELDMLVDAGTIDPTYLESSQYLDCLQEVLEFLDNDIPDPTRFDAIKEVFLVAASENASTREDILPYQYMRLSKCMTSGEILVMLTEYQRVKNEQPEKSVRRWASIAAWHDGIAKSSGLKHAELVALFDEGLIQNKILNPPGVTDSSITTITQNGRLTVLRWNLCDFISQYEGVKSMDEAD